MTLLEAGRQVYVVVPVCGVQMIAPGLFFDAFDRDLFLLDGWWFSGFTSSFGTSELWYFWSFVCIYMLVFRMIKIPFFPSNRVMIPMALRSFTHSAATPGSV